MPLGGTAWSFFGTSPFGRIVWDVFGGPGVGDPIGRADSGTCLGHVREISLGRYTKSLLEDRGYNGLLGHMFGTLQDNGPIDPLFLTTRANVDM